MSSPKGLGLTRIIPSAASLLMTGTFVPLPFPFTLRGTLFLFLFLFFFSFSFLCGSCGSCGYVEI
jgi:hypothetical protein